MIVVDDRLLRQIVLEEEPARLARLRRDHAVATTSCWLYRLCQAVADPSIRGALSGPIADLPADLRDGVVAKLVQLPAAVTLVSWRDLAWPMAELVQRHRLNLLSLEALAVARHLEATLVLGAGTASPALAEAAKRERVPLRFL